MLSLQDALPISGNKVRGLSGLAHKCATFRRKETDTAGSQRGRTMNRTQDSLALTMKDAAKLVGVDYRTIKLGIESGTIPTVQLGPRRMIPRVPQIGRAHV